MTEPTPSPTALDFASVRAATRRGTDAAPPVVTEQITRLVFSDIGLPALFEKKAKENKLDVIGLRVDVLYETLVAFLRGRVVKTVALTRSRFTDKVALATALSAAKFEVVNEETPGVDAVVTDVFRAVAETGSMALRGPTAAAALNAKLHVAVVEPKHCVGDLVDLFKLANDDVTLVSGSDHAGTTRRVFLLK